MSTTNTGNREEKERSLLDQLLEDSRLYKSSQDYLDLLEFIARMRNFAPFNALLLQIQKPGLQFAASKHDWRERFRAEVKKDARPLLILWPFGPVALVYDVVDLVSGNIPIDAQAFVAKGAITEERITAFIKRMTAKNITVNITDYGDGKAGSIQMTELPKDEKTRGCYKMKINGNHTPAVRFVTIAHELAHLFLGHQGEDKKWGIKERRHGDKTQRELEAESVAYLVAKRNGVESRSETYLANYVRDNPTMADLDFYQITRAAGQIETLLGIAAHTQFDPPARQQTLPELSQDPEFYNQTIPQDQLMEIMAVVATWSEVAAPAVNLTPEEEQAKNDLFDAFEGIVDGLRAPELPERDSTYSQSTMPAILADFLATHADGRMVSYSQSIWSALKAFGANGPCEPDWVEVFRSIDSQVSEGNPQLSVGLNFSKGVPLDKRMEILNVADRIYDSGAYDPKDFAAKLEEIDGGKFKQYSHALWCCLRASFPELPNVNDWAKVYEEIDA